MGIEAIGSIGTAMGSVASGIGKGATSLGRVSGEMPSLGSASISGLARFDTGPVPFGAGPIGNFAFLKEGPVSSLKGFVPVGKSDLGNLDLIGGTKQSFNPVGEILFQAKPVLSEAAGAVAEAESIISQASFLSLRDHAPLRSSKSSWGKVAKQSSLSKGEIATSVVSLLPRNDEFVQPMVAPLTVPLRAPDVIKFPKPQIVTSPARNASLPDTVTLLRAGTSVAGGPALEPQIITRTQTKTEQQASAATVPAVKLQPVLQEQNKEAVATERVITKQIDIVEEEEIESISLKDVVDLPVLNKRIEEFGSAVEIAGSKVKEEDREEIDPDSIRIDGKRVVELVGSETAEKRSGLVKEKGPDGSRVETIEAVASKKFSSVKQAKEQIIGIITQKLPVKKAKEGIAVGYEAVARVLRHFFVKSTPAEQTIDRVIKKQLDRSK